jgi:hypothetical protein
MTSVLQRRVLLILGALAANLVVVESARANFGWPPPENLTTVQASSCITIWVPNSILDIVRRQLFTVGMMLAAITVGSLAFVFGRNGHIPRMDFRRRGIGVLRRTDVTQCRETPTNQTMHARSGSRQNRMYDHTVASA